MEEIEKRKYYILARGLNRLSVSVGEEKQLFKEFIKNNPQDLAQSLDWLSEEVILQIIMSNKENFREWLLSNGNNHREVI